MRSSAYVPYRYPGYRAISHFRKLLVGIPSLWAAAGPALHPTHESLSIFLHAHGNCFIRHPQWFLWSGGVLMGKIKGGRGKAWKGEDPQENWEKGQMFWICRGVGVVPSRVIRDKYRM